eukprot:s322_g11.t1
MRTSDGMALCIPYGDGLIAHIPLKSAVTYLGARITYHNSSRATVAHRIAASKHVYHRLKIWLSCNSQIPIDKRYQLWKATVFSTMIYGIFTVGLTPPGLTNIQIEIMRQLRSIAGDFSQITALSHQAFLAHRRWPSPAQLLLTRVEGMIDRLSSRHLKLDPADIVLRSDWQHLHGTAHLLRQAMATDSTSNALHAVLNPDAHHACRFCSRTFATVAAMKLHMHREHAYQQRTFRHTQAAVPALALPAQASPPAADAAGPSRETQSPLFAVARATDLGARTLQFVTQQNWQGIKDDPEMKQWLGTHCVVCNIFVGNLKRMNAHMRQSHPAHIEGLYQLAGVVLKRSGTLSPCEFCAKQFQQEHLCPAMVQAAMILLHEPPSSAEGAAENQRTEASLARSRTRRLVIHDFVTSRDAHQGQPVCSHCQKKFSTIGGLRLHISLDKCPLFDVTRSVTPVPPNVCLLSNLKDGTLMAWLGEDVHRRMQWTCHCQCCGLTYSGASQLANHLQMVHSELWHAATTCTAFLNAYVHTINRCVCNPSPGTVRPEHQCLLLRQVAMQYVRARNAGDFPGLLMPYRITVDELSQFLQHAPIDLCTMLIEALQTPHMAACWTSPHLSLQRKRCLICGYEVDSDPLPLHLQMRHGLHQCSR